MKLRIYVDGEIHDPEHARVRVMDHGFLFGDSVYETLWWHRGVLIQEQEHWERLEASAALCFMDVQHTRAELSAAVGATADAAGTESGDDALVRVVVTRGTGALGLDPASAPRRSLVVIVAPAHRPTVPELERGITLEIVERRRNSPRALDPRAKTGNYLNNLLALVEAQRAGADDALLLNEQGEVAEASTSNVFAVRAGALETPPLTSGILEGTSRRRILALGAREGIPAREARLLPTDLARAEELFLCSSVRGIMPVTRLGNTPVGAGTQGPLTRRLRALVEQAADEEARAASRAVLAGTRGPARGAQG